jgi:branched-subunit amino acid transport protein
MSGDALWLTLGLAAGTYAIRLSGALLGQRLARAAGWAHALALLPGCLIVALVALSLTGQALWVWAVALASAGVAWLSNNLMLTMAVGMGLYAIANATFTN